MRIHILGMHLQPKSGRAKHQVPCSIDALVLSITFCQVLTAWMQLLCSPIRLATHSDTAAVTTHVPCTTTGLNIEPCRQGHVDKVNLQLQPASDNGVKHRVHNLHAPCSSHTFLSQQHAGAGVPLDLFIDYKTEVEPHLGRLIGTRRGAGGGGKTTQLGGPSGCLTAAVTESGKAGVAVGTN
jgi:hypothetical protein